MRSFSYIPDASFSESTLFLPVLVWGFSDTPDARQILMSVTNTLLVSVVLVRTFSYSPNAD